MARRYWRSIGFLVAGALIPPAAIGALWATDTSDGPWALAAFLTAPVGLFLVVSYPVRSRDVRRIWATLRRARWLLVSTSFDAAGGLPRHPGLLVRAVDRQDETTDWIPTGAGASVWAGWAWLAVDPEHPWGVLSPADPSVLVAVAVAGADAVDDAIWIVPDGAGDRVADLPSPAAPPNAEARRRRVRRWLLVVMLVSGALVGGQLVLVRQTHDGGTAAIEAEGERLTVHAVFATGSGRDWQVRYVTDDVLATLADRFDPKDVLIARSDRRVPLGTTMQIARLGDEAVEVGHRPVVRSGGLPAGVPRLALAVLALPLIGLALELIAWTSRRRLSNSDAVHHAR